MTAQRSAGSARRQPQPTGHRKEILEAAALAIASRGYHGMSMRDLASATGRAASTLYCHFESKEALLFALQQESFEDLRARAAAALDGVSDPRARLVAFVDSHVRYVAEHRERMRVLVHEAGKLPPGRRRRVHALKAAYFALARSVVEGAWGRGPAEELASRAELERSTYALFGMLNWPFGWYVAAEHGPVDELVATIVRIALGGLGGPAVKLREGIEETR